MADCGVLISSVSLSGLTTEVTFFPETGGTINLGTQVFPFSYVADYFYGTYNCYVPTYAYSYSVVVLGVTPTPTPTETPTNTPTPTFVPLNLELFAEYTPGSIIASYTLLLNRSYNEEINVSFENVLNVFSGSPITIFTGVTVSLGSLSGQTIVTVDEDYNNYNGEPLFSQLSGTPSGSTYEIFVIQPTPTPTPTNTETPAPTPTNTETPTETPTPTNTETPTETPTNTPSPTQTMTPTNARFAFAVFSGVTFSDACDQINIPTTLYGDNNLFDENTIFYNEFIGPVTINMSGFYNYEQITVELDSEGNTGLFSICSSPTPTPTTTPGINITLINNTTNGVTISELIDDSGSIILENQIGSLPVSGGSTTYGYQTGTSNGPKAVIGGSNGLSFVVRVDFNGIFQQFYTETLPSGDWVYFTLGLDPLLSTDIVVVTISDVPTPTPTTTQTQTPTTTPTNTPTNTGTPTETPTPSPTPTSQVIIEAIIIGTDTYLIVGDNQYLQY